MINEVTWDDKTVSIRTGLNYAVYDKNDISKVIDTDKDMVLEEIINTAQTEMIINIINSFNDYKIDNEEFNNIFYTLKHEVGGDKYVSDAYSFQTFICKELMNNKTFVPTMENLRFKGNVAHVDTWFDDITGVKGSYNRLTKLLNHILDMEVKYSESKYFKKQKLNKILVKSREVLDIIKIFDVSFLAGCVR